MEKAPGIDKSKMKVRRAKHEDYDAIMNLNNNVYDGNDYLPVSLHSFINLKNIVNFVAEIDGKVVGYKAFFLDGPKEAVAIGARVEKKYIGTRLNQKFSQLSNEELRKICPKLEHVTWSAFDSSFYHNAEKMKEYNCTLITRFHGLFWKVTPAQLKACLDAQANTPVSLPISDVTDDCLMHLILDPQNHQRFFPTGYIICYHNWLPLQITLENIRLFINLHVIAVSMETPTRIAAISYSIARKVPLGNAAFFYFDGDFVDNSTLMHHYIYHARRAVEITSEDHHLTTAIMCPLTTDISDLKDKLTSYFGPRKSDHGFELGTGIMAGKWLKPLSKV